MSPRRIVEDFYDRVWNRLDKAAIPGHPDFTFRGSLGPTMTGHAAFSAYVDEVTEAPADYRCTIPRPGDRRRTGLCPHAVWGIHRGLFLGFAPTGQRVDWAGAALFTVKGDKIADLWILGDLQGLRARLQRNAEH
jgi:hypothetical protein